MKFFGPYCVQVAKDLDIPLENLVGLAAEESGYRRGRISIDCKNYFSMRSPAPGQVGFEVARNDPKVKVAKYGRPIDSVESFKTKWGPFVQGKRDPVDFANALVRAGFNTGKNEDGGRAGFANYLLGLIIAVKGRLAC
ncbi:glucosaminidase domain-containing protein [Massilia sp. CCM 8734]|uniref:glucosaminidase domain-containing protein n=1 Tax=Massilia sp. CCM 8734 TaxID=2609283 RepID=UPI0014246CF1|nr:glucosaminidase domain-containing protein [Massilia sp. CCM 8734]NHZ96330.1 hypothetical protein [Massilia sp. CCM 8734]